MGKEIVELLRVAIKEDMFGEFFQIFKEDLLFTPGHGSSFYLGIRLQAKQPYQTLSSLVPFVLLCFRERISIAQEFASSYISDAISKIPFAFKHFLFLFLCV